MEAGEADEEFDSRDAAIYLIQVQGDKTRPVSGESLCCTHRHGSVMFKRDDGLRHNSAELKTAAWARDSIDLWQKSNDFKDCLNSIHPSLIPGTNEWKEHRTVGKFSSTLTRVIHPGLILHPCNTQHFVGVMGNNRFFKFNTIIDIFGGRYWRIDTNTFFCFVIFSIKNHKTRFFFPIYHHDITLHTCGHY